MLRDRGDAEPSLAEFATVGIDRALGQRGQRDGADAFDESWKRLLASIERKT
jgi:hypothetical protein